ncbi:hypothetical protein A2U01_0056044 [Trifolium medium]|uniref:Uncharacterized protein n=1 Tax=Trifolium medium TaxID=97028 RepID=A0A392RDW9_9FABA|nr:hypothetical protein [Trifolium medium]
MEIAKQPQRNLMQEANHLIAKRLSPTISRTRKKRENVVKPTMSNPLRGNGGGAAMKASAPPL